VKQLIGLHTLPYPIPYILAAVGAVDLNNDGKDDLLVGAPHFSKVQDEGRVYVFMNRPGRAFVCIPKHGSKSSNNVKNSSKF